MPEVLGWAPVARAGRGCAVAETGVAGSGRLRGGQVGGRMFFMLLSGDDVDLPMGTPD
jgi:hypothetical protein